MAVSSYRMHEGRMMQKSYRIKNINRSKYINYIDIMYMYSTAKNNFNGQHVINIDVITRNKKNDN